MAKISSTTLAYMAGIIDGEGHIGIRKSKSRGRKNDKYYENLTLALEVASTNEGLIDMFCNAFGGGKYSGKRPNRKPYYRWSVVSAKAEYVLKLLQPYIYLKRTQTVLALEYRKTIGKGGGSGLEKEVKQKREAFRQMIMEIGHIDDTSSRPAIF